ncbi:GAF domain-containing protein [Halobaculum sp. P14]|uniref:GAF domain-containing protein n=1 Tax=Halobaculum sp. P14 TaxID=3421638 RepID=UPI003EB959A1
MRLSAGDALVVSDDDAWSRRFTAAADFEVTRTDSVSEAVQAASDADGYVNCVVVDSAGTWADPSLVFAAVTARFPDAACIVAGTDHPVDPPACEDIRVEVAADRDSPGLVAAAAERAVESGRHLRYPVPDGEADRAAAVRACNVDGLAAGDDLDAVVAEVADALAVDVAFVGLVDTHVEHFVATHGWDPPANLDRSAVVCAHTVLDEGPFVVPDLAADPEFADAPSIEPRAYPSYAGVPVHADGHRVGSLCVRHGEPRSYSAEELETLKRYSAAVDDLLEAAAAKADDDQPSAAD